MASNSNGSDEIGRFEAQYRENPDSLVFARLADACRKAGDPERGLSILADGIGRHPDYPSAHIVRARCLVDLDRLADAEESLRRVIELDPQNLVAIQGLANLAERRDDPAEAVHWYAQIATLDPMNVEAAAALQRLRPAPPPAGHQPLPAPSEEWWSSPAFQIESDEADLPDETDLSDAADPAMEEAPVPPVEDPVRIVAEELTDAAVEPERAGEDEPGAAWWFEDPGEDDPADDGDLLTRTMAELYTKQGLLDEAVAIYRELLTDRPDDEGLRRALDDLERRLDGADDEPESEGPTEERGVPPEAADASPASETVAEAGAATDAEASAKHQVPAEADSAREPEAAREPGADDPAVDRFATHPVPATSGTGEVLDDWLRRLSE